MKTIFAADLFCGAGGASVGLRRACEVLGLGLDLLAVNHWKVAVDTHRANHPRVKHLCEAVERVLPREAIPGGRLHLLMAGPSCVHHSRARGGRPINEQERVSAFCVPRWLSELTVDHALVENVPEFEDWGPVTKAGRPIEKRKGETFTAWVRMIESLGYRVEWRVINAADYGDPQTRRRLWVMARRGRRAPVWPAPTHSRDGGRHLFGRTEAWRPARAVVDLERPSRSIFGRKKPLQPATLKRIFEGLKRFGGAAAEPYLVILRNNMGARSLSDPLPTIAAGGEHVAVVQPKPFLMHVTHGADPGRVHDLDGPAPTVTAANRGELALCSFVLQQQSGGAPRPVAEPLPTVAGRGAISLVQGYMVPMFGEREGQTPRVHSLDEPLPTVTASKGGPALVQPIISPYHGNSTASPISAPLPTVTGSDRLALVMPVVNGQALDILFRMLDPDELAGAQGFPADYEFRGNRGERVKQIGNAWPCATAEALVREILAEYAQRDAKPENMREATA